LKQFDAKIIVSPRGMLGPESLKIKPIKKKLFFVMTKVTGLFKSVKWHASSEIEAAQVQKYFGKKAIIDIAPNFSYLPQKNDSYLPKSTGEINLICVGRIAPIKNIDFLLEVLQEIKGKVNCIIVGPAEDKLYYDLCKQLVSKLKNNVTIQFIEGVNHSELDNLHKASHLFISPTKNENYGHSIVEALGHGCPVVISDKTPWSHLEEKQVGKDLPLDKQQFVSTLQSFVEMDNDTYSNFRVKARLYSEEIFSSGDTKTQYKKLYS
jgi:glycosyltransferase involved in cell wall biosynthesis